MKNQDKYSLDDLLLSRSYADLTTEERQFVARCETSPASYEQQRKSALLMQEVFSNEKDEAPKRIKKDVMAAFDTHHRPAKKTVLLWKSDRNWYNQPLFRIGLAAALLGVLWLVNGPETSDVKKELLTENAKPKENEQKSPPTQDDSVQTQISSNQVDREISADPQQTAFPEKPKNTMQYAEAKAAMPPENEIMELEVAEMAESDDASADAGFSSFDSAVHAPVYADEVQMSARSQANDEQLEQAEKSIYFLLEKRKIGSNTPVVSFKLSDRADWKKDHYTAY